MHSFESKPWPNDWNQTRVHFNSHSDVADGWVEIVVTQTGKSDQVAKVPGKSLLDFVANYVRSRRISALEDETTERLLGLPSKEPA